MVGAAGENAVFFDGYVEETLDPGWSLIVGSLVRTLIKIVPWRFWFSGALL